jgi:hypothetical protein
VADYARRVNLPPTKALDLGDNVKLELVLIPAGKFIMGTPEPKEPTETVAVGQASCTVAPLAYWGCWSWSCSAPVESGSARNSHSGSC